jgi:hypothetical protein
MRGAVEPENGPQGRPTFGYCAGGTKRNDRGFGRYLSGKMLEHA